MSTHTCEDCGSEVKNGARNIAQHRSGKKCKQIRMEKETDMKWQEKCQEWKDMCTSYQDELNELKTSYKELQSQFEQVVEYKLEIARLTTKCEIYEQQLVELKSDNHDDDKFIKQLASKPSVITTHTQNNTQNTWINLTPLDLSEKKIKSIVPNYAMSHYLKGAEGMVEYLQDNLLTDENGKSMYLCSDQSRKVFNYKNANGEKVVDIGANKLIESVKPHLGKTVEKYKKIEDEAIMEKYGDLDSAYEFVGGQTKIGKCQMNNHRLKNTAFDIAKILTIKCK